MDNDEKDVRLAAGKWWKPIWMEWNFVWLRRILNRIGRTAFKILFFICFLKFLFSSILLADTVLKLLSKQLPIRHKMTTKSYLLQ